MSQFLQEQAPLGEENIKTQPGDPIEIRVHVSASNQPFTGLATLILDYGITAQAGNKIRNVMVDLVPRIDNDPSPHPKSVKFNHLFQQDTITEIVGRHLDTKFPPTPISGVAEIYISIIYSDIDGNQKTFNLLPVPSFPFVLS